MFFFESRCKLNKIRYFLSSKDLSQDEHKDLLKHAKQIILTKIINYCLDHLDSSVDREYFLSMIHKDTDSEEVINFLAVKARFMSLEKKIAELEEEILLVLISD